jgi:hypothetical protein
MIVINTIKKFLTISAYNKTKITGIFYNQLGDNKLQPDA